MKAQKNRASFPKLCMYYVTALYVAGACNYDFCSQFRIVSARSLMETEPSFIRMME